MNKKSKDCKLHLNKGESETARIDQGLKISFKKGNNAFSGNRTQSLYGNSRLPQPLHHLGHQCCRYQCHQQNSG
jgi:hypothetical protein